MLVKRNLQLENSLQNFHCGERFKELCVKYKREAPSEWVKILGLKSRNQVYYRWTSQELDSKELLIICDQFQITVDEFFNNSNATIFSSEKVSEKVYIEDQIAELQSQVAELQKHYQIRKRQ